MAVKRKQQSVDEPVGRLRSLWSVFQPYFWTAAVLALGLLLRLDYLQGTPYSVRSHDYDAHIDYIQYISDHGWFPHAQDGWEFHQPPLYYALVAVPWKIGSLLGFERDPLIVFLQYTSLLFSFLLVPLSYWIGSIQFKRQADRHLLAAIVAAFPALVFNAARVSNDLLYPLLMLVGIGLLLRWYEKQKPKDWYGLAIVLGIGLVTKLNVLLLLVASAVAYVWRMHWNGRGIGRGVLAALLVVLLAGWLPIMRSLEPERRNLIPRTEGLSEDVLLENTWESFLTFNPIQVVRIPYVSALDDETRRQYFWEYFFRSAFSGEWHFVEWLEPLSSAILVTALLSVILILFGVAMALRTRWTFAFPQLALLLTFLAGAVGYRVLNICSCSQDFRYVLPLVVPAATFAILGATSLPRGFSSIGKAVLVGFVILSSVFILLIPPA